MNFVEINGNQINLDNVFRYRFYNNELHIYPIDNKEPFSIYMNDAEIKKTKNFLEDAISKNKKLI